jgi:hypothetical protein
MSVARKGARRSKGRNDSGTDIRKTGKEHERKEEGDTAQSYNGLAAETAMSIRVISSDHSGRAV